MLYFPEGPNDRGQTKQMEFAQPLQVTCLPLFTQSGKSLGASLAPWLEERAVREGRRRRRDLHRPVKLTTPAHVDSMATLLVSAAVLPVSFSVILPKSAARYSTGSTFTSRFRPLLTRTCAANPSVRLPPRFAPASNPPAKCSATAATITRKCLRRNCGPSASWTKPASERSRWLCAA
jgi:hypothetical protein